MNLRKIIIACDSFKGSLSSEEAARACTQGINEAAALRGCTIETRSFAIGDGGEGTSAIIARSLGAAKMRISVPGPLGDMVDAIYYISSDGKTAIMDMSAASGITLVPHDRLNPLDASTYGTGLMILDALRRGCRRIVIGLGGSATTDAGTGMLQALGFKLHYASPFPLRPCGRSLEKLTGIDDSEVPPILADTEFIAACDVANPLYGPRGAACVFAPQKGASPDEVRLLDHGLRHFAHITASRHANRRRTLFDSSFVEKIASFPGSGAAGGLGFTLMNYLGARLSPGIDIILDACGFDEAARDADLIITGEGRLDAQTLMGKAPEGIRRRAARLGVPVIAIGGSVSDDDSLLRAGFRSVHSIMQSPQPLAEALLPANATANIARTLLHLTLTLLP